MGRKYKSKKLERFEPENDGIGKVICNAKGRDMKRINKKPNGGVMSNAFRDAGLSR